MSEPGYVYVLKNNSFQANVVKIGLTTRAPDVRAREIYQGATGVPQPFTVAVAYTVADCQKAEKMIHARLNAYRVNKKREFFRSPMRVAEQVVLECCAAVNSALGMDAPERTLFPASERAIQKDKSWYRDSDLKLVDPGKLKPSPVRRELTAAEQDRVSIVFQLLECISPLSQSQFTDGFMRDERPNSEIMIWENMAKAYLSIEHGDIAPEELRKEAFGLLLQRTWSTTHEVLKVAKLKYFTRETARALLDSYELPPQPLLVRDRRAIPVAIG